MKTLTLIKTIALSLALVLGCYNAYAMGDTLTIRQIFDLKVGDTLIYTGYEDVSQINGGYGPNYVYHGRWGFSITGVDSSTDSTVFHYQVIGGGEKRDLVVHTLDSSLVNTKSYYYYNDSAFLQMFRWWGPGVSLNNYPKCDSGWHCSMDTLVYPQYGQINLNNYAHSFFEGLGGTSFMEKCGVFYVYGGGENYYGQTWNNNTAPGSATIQLIYYHSDSTIWIDTANYILSDISAVKPELLELKIQPNPSTGSFLLETGNGNFEASGTIKVFDLQSRIVLEQKMLPNTNKQEIKLSDASSGLYIVSIENPSSGIIWRGKLMKQ